MSLRPRFSLRTLLLLVLAIGAGIGVWWRWEPWVEIETLKLGGGTKPPKNGHSPNARLALGGQRIVTVEQSGIVEIWDTNGMPRTNPSWGTELWRRIEISPGGRFVCSIPRTSDPRLYGTEGKVLLWDLDKELDRSIDCPAPVSALEFSDDGLNVFLGCSNGTAFVHNIRDGKEAFSINGQIGWVFRGAFSRDQRYLATVSKDEIIHVWNGTTGQFLRTLKGGSTKSIYNFYFSPDSKRLITFTWDDKVCRLWDPATGELIARFEGIRRIRAEGSMTPDSSRLLLTTDGTELRDSTNGDLLVQFTDPHGAYRVISDNLSPDGRRALCGSEYGRSRLFNTETGQLVAQLEDDASIPLPWAYSFSLTRILTVTSRNRCRISNLEDGTTLCFLQHRSPLTSVEFRPNSSMCVTATDQGAHIWRRRRLENAYGLDWPEIWLAGLSLSALIYSFLVDRRTLKR